MARRVVIYYENPEFCDPPQAIWVRDADEPHPDLNGGADYLLPVGRMVASAQAVLRWVDEEFRPGALDVAAIYVVGHGIQGGMQRMWP